MSDEMTQGRLEQDVQALAAARRDVIDATYLLGELRAFHLCAGCGRCLPQWSHAWREVNKHGRVTRVWCDRCYTKEKAK